MRALVLGAGVVGVTTAHQLLKDGHEVTVVDRAEEAASFTSHANAGLVAPGHSYAWSSPRAPGMMLRSFYRDDQAIRFRPSLSPALWLWSLKFLKQCTAEGARRNTQEKSRICIYSQELFKQLTEETGVLYDGNDGGLIYFYRSAETFDLAAGKCEILRNEGVPVDILSAAETAARDPGLADAEPYLAGSLYARTDESGDTRLFTLALAEECRKRGARFVKGTTVTALERAGSRITAALTDHDRLTADQYVLCLGVFSPALVKDLGLRLPIYPVKGYSVTLPVEAEHTPPRLGGVDEDNLLAYCPMGKRMRYTATAEFAGYDDSHKPADFKVMMRKAREVFPRAADYGRPIYWAGLRPMTPTGLPIIGPSPIDNLWLNTGHGHMGWTMACGSARVLADLMAGKKPAIDAAAMSYEAY
jgi:D-amino-acid dehydrogenase